MSLLDMMEEPSRARKNDPRTSKEAASDTVRIGTVRHAILYLLIKSFQEKGHYGMTTFELAERMGVRRDTVSPNMKPLVRMGLITETDETRGLGGKYLKSMIYIISELGLRNKSIILSKPPSKYIQNSSKVCPHCGQEIPSWKEVF
jgi:DNA-binding transcriptional ArsR family regulator